MLCLMGHILGKTTSIGKDFPIKINRTSVIILETQMVSVPQTVKGGDEPRPKLDLYWLLSKSSAQSSVSWKALDKTLLNMALLEYRDPAATKYRGLVEDWRVIPWK